MDKFKNQSFLEFSNDANHVRPKLKNQIYYKGKPVDKWEAYWTFLSYDRMVADSRITIQTMPI